MIKSKRVPIQIYLDPDQFKMIDLLSKSRNTSKAATIRNCIAQYLEIQAFPFIDTFRRDLSKNRLSPRFT